jgi:tripeptidyl-peptidase-1
MFRPLTKRSSHPDSEHYGKHYSVEEVTELFAPSQDSVEAVRAWLESAGIAMDSVSQSVNKQWLQFDAKVSEAEKLLHTEYHEYEHAASGKSGIACDGYHLPSDVQAHVDYITPGVKHIGTHGSDSALAKRDRWGNGWGKGKGHRRRPHPPPTRPMPPGPMPTKPANLTACGTMVTPACIRVSKFYLWRAKYPHRC